MTNHGLSQPPKLRAIPYCVWELPWGVEPTDVEYDTFGPKPKKRWATG